MRKLDLKKLELGKRMLPTVGVVTALVMGTLLGMHMEKAPPAPTLHEIKGVVMTAVVPVRNDVRDLAIKVAPPAKTEVIVQPVKTEAITVAPTAKKKVKKAAPKDTGIFTWLKN